MTTPMILHGLIEVYEAQPAGTTPLQEACAKLLNQFTSQLLCGEIPVLAQLAKKGPLYGV